MSHGHDDFAGEPVYGLPEELPAGESILWQGHPLRAEVACRIYHIRLIALYFLVLAGWEIMSGIADGIPAGTLAYGIFGLSLAASATLGFIWWLAHATARETVYTITNERVVIRFGVALELTLNLPFKQIRDAAVALKRNGTGDIALTLDSAQKLSWFALWPHTRPFRPLRAQPTLRCLPDVAAVAVILGDALQLAIPEARQADPAAVADEHQEQPLIGAFG